ncbi:response regulator [Pseudogemmobacter sonorensis]|uniref:response regulator n=1 Tax=Pseudogemmobacter sonorensis TaxID=2989681 RepID=UPI00369B99B2
MELTERLARERRARLAAERLLEQRTRELSTANQRLALHARALSDQIVEQRAQTRFALSEAETLKGQNSRYQQDLQRVRGAVAMAETRLWESLDAIRDGFAVFDSGLNLIVANRAYCASFGGLRVEPGMSYRFLLETLLARELIEIGGEDPARWLDRMMNRLDLDPIPPATLHFTEGFWVRLADRRARDGDLASLAVNTTEQMRIRAAIEAIADGFVLFDREDRLQFCNQSYRDIYAASAPALQPGTTFEEILRYGLRIGQYPDAVGREEEWLAERMREHRGLSALGEHQAEDGRWIRSIDKATPDGGRVGLRMDITQLRAQAEALETARRQAEAANRAKSAFLANMSHEIRTPMNGVVGMAELLCDTGLNDEQRLFAETIRSSGEALLVIINDVLDYSKIEAERLTLHPEPFDLERTIHEVVMLLQPRARARGLDLMIDYDVLLPTRFVGDPGRLRQVLTNLIGNAVKFTETGHVLTRVVGIETGPGSRQLHVTIEDTGIGIPPEHLDRIFGEFNQVEDERNRKFEGTGLGLTITRRLIEHMGGTVWVDSAPGKGSSFGFRLTLDLAEAADPIRPPVTIRSALVVDDRFINRTILERQLTPCGIEVVLCRSGAEALAAVEAGGRFDIVLTDHEMPGMDGVTLAERLRAAGLTMPILLLSSSPTQARAHESAGLLDAIMQKPLLRAELYARLREFTEDLPEPQPEPEAPAPPPLSKARQMRVLAAEDNMTNQLVFRKMLRDLDLDLAFASNGREALALWESFAPDLIFMDISMPEMDGKEAARRIRAAESERAGPEAGGGRPVPIIALTAHAMEGDAEAILAAGIDLYMTKPLRKAAILKALADHCPADARLSTASAADVAPAGVDTG